MCGLNQSIVKVMHVFHPAVASFFWVLAALFGIVPLFLRGDRVIYLMILTWFFYPNWAIHIIGFCGIPPFTFLQVFQSIALLLLIFKKNKLGGVQILLDNREKRLIQLFFIVIVIQWAIGSFVVSIKYAGLINIPWSIYIINFVGEFATLVFFYGCYHFIHTIKQVEIVFYIFLITGLVLALEFFIAYHPFLFFHRLVKYMFIFTPEGDISRFQSLFLNDVVAVPLWSAISSLIALYFYFVKRKKIYLLFFSICVLTVLFDFTRGVLLGLILGVLFYLYKQFGKKALLFLLALIFVSMVVFFSRQILIKIAANMMPNQYFHTRVEQIQSVASTADRVGQIIRGLQVLRGVFPFGVSPYLAQYYMPINKPPFLTPQNSSIFKYYISAYHGYKRVTYDGINAQIQNWFVEFVVSYGLAGIIFLLVAIRMLFYNLKLAKSSCFDKNKVYQIAAIIISFFVLYVVFFMFFTTPVTYVALIFFVHVTFMLAHSRKNALEFLGEDKRC